MQKLFILIVLVAMQSPTTGQVLRKPIPDKTIVLTFDDAVKSDASYVPSLLKKYKFGGTFFICEFPDFSDSSKYMNWKEIKQLYDSHFEIGNHTRSHKHLNKMTAPELIEQVSYITNKCDSAGIVAPVSFAYPSSYAVKWAVNTLIAQGILLARTNGERAYDPEKDHPLYIPSFGVSGSDNRKMFYDALSEAKDGKVVVFTFHGIPDYAHNWVSTPPALFEEYLQYLHKHNYHVISLNALLPYLDISKARQLPIPPDTKK